MYVFIQDPDPGSDPELSEKSDPDPGSDPKKIIPDPQHCSEIRSGLFIPDPDPDFTHPGSRIQGPKRHRIPDPDLDPDPDLYALCAFHFLFTSSFKGVP